jgi:hypothetical protein
MSLRQLRKGEVSFYRVKDFFTGTWLLKLCNDKEQEKILIKAVKCPAGIRFSQLEGRTMVFQKSKIEGMLYDVISLTQADEDDKVKRKIVSSVNEVPAVIRENFVVKSYEEATGKKAPGKYVVTLTKQEDEKEIVTLFVLERAWGLSQSSPEEKLAEKEEEKLQQKKTAKKEVDTGQVWSCPICGKQHRLVHVETEKTVKHALRKPHPEQIHNRKEFQETKNEQ